ncbi:cell division and transport-associated protein TolA [Litoreibacter halocynthiae]|uniref:Cell division and transport-associated protein TolA n=1 Tax=Litoreibacter halocynthiae TaxID=1242689 RepID=A0A4R7LM62_9RHOB|nr:energy transducer TonB [Litoreibacter halocynthiae]TDT75220.1 cell division and transport-associated protein TolA [Litoreibacter halocynthiae]
MRISPNTGTYVSGAGHAAFILYLIVGGLFVARDTDFEVKVSNVSIISGEEFASMQAQSPGEGELPPAPEVPADVDQPAPAVEPETPSAPPPTPRPVEEVAPEPEPVIPEPAEAVEAPVVPEQPEAPDVDGDPGDTLIVPDAVPVPRPAERIAEEVVEQPDPEVAVGETDQAATAPAAEPTPVEEAQEETAREEATTEIVTEADEPSTSAPTKSTRPGRKPKPPARPAPQVAETPTETPSEAPSLADSIANAVAEANTSTAVADNANPGGGTSSPITRSEKGAFILGIQKCWNVGALGTDALAVSVVVGFQMEQNAKPIVGSIRMISSTGGSGVAVEKAYEAARRAIIRCGASGYNLPLDKYDQWREVEVSFNATKKEIR